jgi:2-C-methyl-D-erythritol 4-phosphate cytidylyltransferase
MNKTSGIELAALEIYTTENFTRSFPEIKAIIAKHCVCKEEHCKHVASNLEITHSFEQIKEVMENAAHRATQVMNGINPDKPLPSPGVRRAQMHSR